MPHPERLATITDRRKVVLVSGCSSGIGQALAIEFASRNKEYHVFASARNLESLRSLPSSIERIQLDVTDEESTRRCVESIIAQVGRIDVLVNNAGVNTATGPSVEVELDRYKSTFEANFFGLIRLTQHVAPHMMDRRRGQIIQIGSTVGLVPLPYAAAYAASKAAVHSFSETLGMELKGFNVDVTVVAPGAITSSIGEKNVKHIKLPNDSRYKNVEDMVQCECAASHSLSAAPSAHSLALLRPQTEPSTRKSDAPPHHPRPSLPAK